MSDIETVSGNIKYSTSGLRQENYFIQTSSTLLGLDTQYVTPNDLRTLADHLDQMRKERDGENENEEDLNTSKTCPICRSSNIARRYASFWASVDQDGEDMAPNFRDHESNTELTDDALCHDCQHEFMYEV